MNFYVILQNILEEQGITVAEAARICKIPRSTLKSIIRRESETTTLEIALKISEGLKVPIERLIGIKANAPPKETKFLEYFRELNDNDQNIILHTMELVKLKKLKKSNNPPKEIELLENFRRLNDEGQKYMLQTMKMAVGTYERKNDDQKREA